MGYRNNAVVFFFLLSVKKTSELRRDRNLNEMKDPGGVTAICSQAACAL